MQKIIKKYWPQIAVGMMMLIASLLAIGLLVKVGNSNKEIAKLQTQINKVQTENKALAKKVNSFEGKFQNILIGLNKQTVEFVKTKNKALEKQIKVLQIDWLKRVNSKIELKRFNVGGTLHGRTSVASWLKLLKMEKAELETFLKLTNFKFYKHNSAIFLLDSVKDIRTIKTNKMQELK